MGPDFGARCDKHTAPNEMALSRCPIHEAELYSLAPEPTSMNRPPDPRVTIGENGRLGTLDYQAPGGIVRFDWEFGGGDVVAIIQVRDRRAWASGSSWFGGRKAEILRFVCAEAIRQKAPRCRAEIDERTGTILLRQ